jgi:hypothetical protein
LERDEEDVGKIVEQLQKFNPFGRDQAELICISTNVKYDLLTGTDCGKDLVKQFLHTRLVKIQSAKFHEPIKKKKSRAFASLHTVVITDKSR